MKDFGIWLVLMGAGILAFAAGWGLGYGNRQPVIAPNHEANQADDIRRIADTLETAFENRVILIVPDSRARPQRMPQWKVGE